MEQVSPGVTKGRGEALFLQKAMRTNHSVRGRFVPHNSLPRARKPVSGMEQPGCFQLTLLRAYGLHKAYRDVFLMKEIQGHTLAQIAATLGISIDTALVRLKHARREI